MAPKKVAILTAGGLAPCLSSCVASLIEEYTALLPDTEIYCYLNGFRALPISDKIRVTPEMVRQVHALHLIGGSPIGNSRVSMDNPEDCYQRKLVPRGENPWHVACDSVVRDGIDVIHPIGGDGTSIGASRLAHFSHERHSGYKLAVIGLPKTIDNDIVPISQSLGAHTAAKEGAVYFSNVVGENSAANRTLLVHELMGRHCGYLAAETARLYREKMKEMVVLAGNDFKRDIHAIYLPEMEINFDSEICRLKELMDKIGCVNIFVSEGAGVEMITSQMEKAGKRVERDASGNIKLSKINIGQWVADNFGPKIKAEKSLVVKSGYFCRAAAAGEFDRKLIKKCCHAAVKEAIKGNTGIVGPNERNNGKVELIPLNEISGGRKFDVEQKWFQRILKDIGQSNYHYNKKCTSQMLTVPKSKSFRSKSPQRNQGLFISKKELEKSEETFTNEVNFASSSNALISSSETEEYLLDNILKDATIDKKDLKGVKEIILNLMVSLKFISGQINKAGVIGNIEEKKIFDILSYVAGNTIASSLKQIHTVNHVIIRGKTKMNKANKHPDSVYDVYCDPLDGENNIKANLSTGVIFAVYRNHGGEERIHRGEEALFSGYCMFGTAAVLVIGFRGRVVSFKLDVYQEKFVLLNENVKIPLTGDYFSVNTAYYDDWEDEVKGVMDKCKLQHMKLRYVGTFVSDIHRTLLNGGIFFYPRNKKFKNGKLTLTTEANPMAFLLECAGGVASDGKVKITGKQPGSFDDTTPFFAGSKDLIEKLDLC